MNLSLHSLQICSVLVPFIHDSIHKESRSISLYNSYMSKMGNGVFRGYGCFFKANFCRFSQVLNSCVYFERLSYEKMRFNSSLQVSNSIVLIDYCEFWNCNSVEGAGLNINGDFMRISNSFFKKCISTKSGGAIISGSKISNIEYCCFSECQNMDFWGSSLHYLGSAQGLLFMCSATKDKPSNIVFSQSTPNCTAEYSNISYSNAIYCSGIGHNNQVGGNIRYITVYNCAGNRAIEYWGSQSRLTIFVNIINDNSVAGVFYVVNSHQTIREVIFINIKSPTKSESNGSITFINALFGTDPILMYLLHTRECIGLNKPTRNFSKENMAHYLLVLLFALL